MKEIIIKIIVFVFIFCSSIFCEDIEKKIYSFNVDESGDIPVWLVAGPFEEPTVGFGSPVFELTSDISETKIYWGKNESSEMISRGSVTWFPQSIDKKGFLNFNDILSWQKPGNSPEKVWYSKAACAYINIISEVDQDAILLTGSNFGLLVSLNGIVVKTISQIRNASADTDTIHIHLNKGNNSLLTKVWNSQQNYTVSFFIPTLMEWGQYVKLVDKDYKPIKNVSYSFESTIKENSFELNPTFFFKKSKGELTQRLDLTVVSTKENANANFELKTAKGINKFNLEQIPFGVSRYELYLPEIEKAQNVRAILKFEETQLDKIFPVKPSPKFKMHVMMLSHTDVGYTHPQPIVMEMHAATLDEVIDFHKTEPDFRWSVETMWQLEQFKKFRSKEKFAELIELKTAAEY